MTSSSLSAHIAFGKCAFLKMLAYRLRYYTGIFTYLIFVSVYHFIWKAVYANQHEGALINGFTFSEMVTYIAIGWIARSFYFSNIDNEVHNLVRSGQITSFLLRPVSFQTTLFCQALGESLFRLLFFSIPIGLVIVSIFPVTLPTSTLAFAYFALSTFLGFAVLVALNFIIGLLAFFFHSIEGIMRAKHNIIMLLSGLLLPMTFFPPAIQSLLEWMPFQAIAYIPLAIYLGKVSEYDILDAVLLQASWFLILTLVGALMWHRAMRSLTVQGG